MSALPEYRIVWQDHYRFDVLQNGERYLSDCEPSLYGLVITTFRGRVTSTTLRPRPTFKTWLNHVVREIFGD